MTKSVIFKKCRSPSPTPELPSRGRCHHNRRLCLQIMIMRQWLFWLMMMTNMMICFFIIIPSLIKNCTIISLVIINITKPSVMNTTTRVCFVPGRMTPPQICVSSAELSFYWQEGEIATTGKSKCWICKKILLQPPAPCTQTKNHLDHGINF